MGRIIVLCEGDTEELAIRRFVTRQWQADGFKSIGLRAENLQGRLQDVGPKARLFLDEGDVLAVFTPEDSGRASPICRVGLRACLSILSELPIPL